ncbi:MAG TPA: PEP-CTERM sorting domain-containing protein [Tepidisphaeraceae bacterium]|jgi:hypothetical protein|nr:PEP-CTERM sorting domain-containing protein [Tepidisphaeraceae bacterium]
MNKVLRGLSVAGFTFLLVLSGRQSRAASPTLSITSTTGMTSIPVGTSSFQINVSVNAGGSTTDGVEYYLSTTGPTSVAYATNPVTSLNDPFTSSDLQFQPSGTLTSGHNGTTAYSHGSDYAAFSSTQAIATDTLNTSSLTAGQYVFTPNFIEFDSLANGNNTTTFGTPGTFTLNVTPTPEPGAMGILLMGSAGLILRRRRLGPAN